MHPMMMMALARDVERDRRRERHDVQLRSLALANRAQALQRSPVGGFARRLVAGISLRPRLS